MGAVDVSAAGTQDEAPRSRPVPWKGLGLLVLAALLLRLCVILAPPDELFERGQVPQEELLRGIAAKEFLDGPLAPLLDYQVNHFWGGSLVVSLLAVPAYAVLGPTIVALRSVSLVFSLGAVVLAFLLLDRFASRRAAWIGAALMAFPPPGYAILGCSVYGTHMESNALALALVLLYLAWRANGRGGVARTVLFGAASGFALWFGYGLLVVLLVAAFFELCADKLFFLRRAFRPWWIGFVIGFLPWIAYSATHGFRGMKVYETSLTGHFVIGLTQGTAYDMEGQVRVRPWTKLWDFFARDWAESLWFRVEGLDGIWLGRAFVLVLLLLAAVAVRAAAPVLSRAVRSLFGRSNGRPSVDAGAFAALFCLLFLAAWVTSDFSIGPRQAVQNFRYLMPLFPFVAVLVAVGADRLMERGTGARRAAWAAVALLVCASAAGTAARCDPQRLESNWATPGHRVEWFARFLLVRFGADEADMDRIVSRIEATRDDAEAGPLYAALARGLGVLSRTRPDQTDETAEARERRAGYARTLDHLCRRVHPRWRDLFVAARSP